MTTTRRTLLVVDDVADNIAVMVGILTPHYRVLAARSGERALELLEQTEVDLVLLDVMMPGLSGFEVCQRMQAQDRLRPIPVIFVTAMGEIQDEARGLALGAVDYLTKPVSAPIVLARVSTHLQLYDQERHLSALVAERTAELQASRLQIIYRLGRAAEYRDNETGLHVIRMSRYARLLAEAIGCPLAWCDLLEQASPMHDVGKIGIPDAILLKPGPLDDREWEMMRRHPEIGANIIGEHDSPVLQLAHSIALHHHEHWDGSGYPRGLSGLSIPLEGRVVILADVFDALTTARPYKPAWPVAEAVHFIELQRGLLFDPELTSVFLGLLPQLQQVRACYQEGLSVPPRGSATQIDASRIS